ncbi:hypothetical protein [Edaphovirga cremea]|uniref:hypothetical protein n=1 Tax=Edaphovirga cremea TaxID=2267246 RepID=UPI00398950CF
MAIGIWTGVAGTTKLTAFGDLLSTLANKVKPLTVTAGPHVRFVNMGCLPFFVVPSPTPASDADGLARGIPVSGDEESVLALAAGSYFIYSPYERLSLISTEGTLT